MRQANGIALRAIDAIPADKIDSTPIPNMRTPKQLVVHIYAMVFREMAEGTLRGEIRQLDEAEIANSIKTRADLVTFAKESWAAADRAISKFTDQTLAQNVTTPWEFAAPGAMMVRIIPDEFLHHRGQLYAYVRALGATPPMVWDFENNEAEYRPKQSAQA
jgi:uncharacterized damage-inducible protein DinB